LFASEIKQFSGFKSQWDVNEEILMDYLIFNLIDHKDDCFFSGVKKLQGSHNLIYDLDTNKFEITKYYNVTINGNVSRLNEEDTIKLFQDEMNRSIEWRLRSDVKVGTCLSGGLDSSYIAALAGIKYQNGQERFMAVTARSVDIKHDESDFAKKVADAGNLNWLVTTPTSADFISALDKVIYNQEEPFISPSVFMQHFVMKKAKEGGIVVLLDGQGADEVLLGYPRYLGAYFKTLPPADLATNILKSKDHFGMSALSIFKYNLYFTSFSVRYKRNMWNFKAIADKYLDFVDPDMIRKIANSYKDIKTLQQLELFSTQLPSLLRFEDKNSMASSIESRVPFLDWNLVEMSLSINNQFKIRNGWSKYILRKSMEGSLPDDITWRKKKFGFNAPTSMWFEDFTNLNAFIHQSTILNKLFNNKIPDFQDQNIQWRLVNIARWEELYNMQIN